MTEGINTGLDSEEEKRSEPEDIAVEEITHRNGEMAPEKRAEHPSGRCGTTLAKHNGTGAQNREERLGRAQPKLSKVDENIKSNLKNNKHEENHTKAVTLSPPHANPPEFRDANTHSTSVRRDRDGALPPAPVAPPSPASSPSSSQ